MDKYDIPFLFKSINDEMPKITEKTAKVKHSYSQRMPKNLSEYMGVINEKFLDNSLATIEDYSLKFPDNELTQWFKDYQNRYFNSVLLKDSFLRIDDDGNFGTIRNYRPMSIQNVGFLGSLTNKVKGADLTAGGTTNNSTSLVGLLNAIKLTTLGTIGHYYDRVAFDWNAAAGNERVGVYDDSSNPTNLMAESTSSANATGFGWKSVTEFALTTTQNWAAMCADNASASAKYMTTGGNNRTTRSFTYGALPNPFGGTPSADNGNLNCKIGHS